jgi:hypothetical protein
VPEGETDIAAELTLDLLDLPEGQARVRALVVTVLDDQATRGGATDMIYDLVKRLDRARHSSDASQAGHAPACSASAALARASRWPSSPSNPEPIVSTDR